VAVIEGAQSRSGGLQNAGAPAAGTDEVQTLTIGGTPTGGTFRLSYDGRKTTDIPWANVNATLIASIDAALEALPNLGAGAVVTAVGSMTAGIGTATITFSGTTTAKKSHPTILVERNDLTGTAPTVAVAETTPGVDRTGSRQGNTPGGRDQRHPLHQHRNGGCPDLDQGRNPDVVRDRGRGPGSVPHMRGSSWGLFASANLTINIDRRRIGGRSRGDHCAA
jgi:hypothetical protein